jgi:hypothetical protein
MINLLCPLELSPRRTGGRRIDDYENASNSISNSVAESDSIDAESGFEDQVSRSHSIWFSRKEIFSVQLWIKVYVYG